MKRVLFRRDCDTKEKSHASELHGIGVQLLCRAAARQSKPLTTPAWRTGAPEWPE